MRGGGGGVRNGICMVGPWIGFMTCLPAALLDGGLLVCALLRASGRY